nr:cytochrome c oxidase subunit 3 [Actornithophilus grandiceps]
MMKHGFFSFHIVDQSPWPILMSMSIFTLMVNQLEIFMFKMLPFSLVWSILFMALTLYGWGRDISMEGFLQGSHTSSVQSGLKMGMILFISSEIFFFFSFFWTIFYMSISPSPEIGGWPPTGVQSVDPLGPPLLGTLILISSGISITWSHHSVLEGSKTESIVGLAVTIILGLMFSLLQLNEYYNCSFSVADSSFGSIFFLSTGFHGVHVILGSSLLLICLIRLCYNHFSSTHHLGYEASIWYWHFVDVVWLFLYICLYWWSS